MTADQLAKAVRRTRDGVEIDLKVVPGASRSRLAGLLGDRLKVAVAAPPEGGKANKAVCRLLAAALGIAPRDVTVLAGPTQPQKTVHIAGITPGNAVEKLLAAAGK